MNSNPKTLAVRLGLALVALTLVCYAPLAGNKFINVDDPVYVVKNDQVNHGVTWPGVRWAFQTSYACNWHPLTWISHMVDCSLFGLNPAGHHLMSLAIHVANVLLLLILFSKMTGAVWRSALMAAFFAWHPLRVESVAWASERKDVLSMFFFLLTLLAYVKYAEAASIKSENRGRWYRAALLLFALGLMAKPMLVTLPFVLLLLDFWPLQRWGECPSPGTATFDHPVRRSKISALLCPGTGTLRQKMVVVAGVWRLLPEKAPFFLLSAGSSIVTYWAQHAGGAVSGLNGVPMSLRLGNIFVSYWRYVAKTLWPANLVSMYPLPDQISLFVTGTAALGLAGVCAFAVLRSKSQPYLIVGWFWFLGTLVPAIGLVQVGAQAMADRYTYIPGIGLLVIAIWGATDLIAVWRERAAEPAARDLNLSPLRTGTSRASVAVASLVIVLLGSCMACTWFQVRYWRDGETLQRHTLQVDPQNYVACEQLGTALADSGQTEQALASLNQSVRLAPNYPEAHYNLGTIYLQEGRLEQALEHLKTAVSLSPNDANAHHNLGNVYVRLKQYPQATTELAIAATLKPGDAPVRLALGNVLLTQERFDEAAILFSEVIRLAPDTVEAYRNLGIAYAREGKLDDAIKQFTTAVKMDPKTPELHFNLGLALLDSGQVSDAAAQFAEVLRLRPNDSSAHFRLAICLSRQQDRRQAIPHFREVLRLNPNFPDALIELATIMTTAPEPDLRNPHEALELAQKARDLALANGQTEVAKAAEAVLEKKAQLAVQQ